MQALKAEAKHAKKELVEEKGQIFSMKLAANLQAGRHHRVEKGQRRAEEERKEIAGNLLRR